MYEYHEGSVERPVGGRTAREPMEDMYDVYNASRQGDIRQQGLGISRRSEVLLSLYTTLLENSEPSNSEVSKHLYLLCSSFAIENANRMNCLSRLLIYSSLLVILGVSASGRGLGHGLAGDALGAVLRFWTRLAGCGWGDDGWLVVWLLIVFGIELNEEGLP